MNTDLLIGGASAAAMIAFLVQTTREATNIQSRYLPLMAIMWAFLLALANSYLPSALVENGAKLLLVAAGVSAGIRYVKNGEQKGDDPIEHPAGSLQGDDIRRSRNSSPQRLRTTTVSEQQRLDRVSNLQPLNHSPILKKSSATGSIQLGDDGSYTITIPYSELTRALFPQTAYEYSVIITEGDTGQRFALRKGPFTFETIALPS